MERETIRPEGSNNYKRKKKKKSDLCVGGKPQVCGRMESK